MTERRFTPRRNPAAPPKPAPETGPLSSLFGTVSDIGRETKRIATNIGLVFAGAVCAIAFAVNATPEKKDREP